MPDHRKQTRRHQTVGGARSSVVVLATSHHARDSFNLCSARNQSSSGDPQGRPRASQYMYANSAIALSSMLSNRESALWERLIGVSGNWGAPSGCRCSSDRDTSILLFINDGGYPSALRFPNPIQRGCKWRLPVLLHGKTNEKVFAITPNVESRRTGRLSGVLLDHLFAVLFRLAAPIAVFTCF
jgi:hypothetical protein